MVPIGITSSTCVSVGINNAGVMHVYTQLYLNVIPCFVLILKMTIIIIAPLTYFTTIQHMAVK